MRRGALRVQAPHADEDDDGSAEPPKKDGTGTGTATGTAAGTAGAYTLAR